MEKIDWLERARAQVAARISRRPHLSNQENATFLLADAIEAHAAARAELEEMRIKWADEGVMVQSLTARLAETEAELDRVEAERDALREALVGLADVIEHNLDYLPCIGSIAPGEHYLGLARQALATHGGKIAFGERELSLLDAVRALMVNVGIADWLPDDAEISLDVPVSELRALSSALYRYEELTL